MGPDLIGLVSWWEEMPACSISLSPCEHGGKLVRFRKKAAVCKPGRESSPGSKSAGILILDFPDSSLWEIIFCCFRSLSGILIWQPDRLCRLWWVLPDKVYQWAFSSENNRYMSHYIVASHFSFVSHLFHLYLILELFLSLTAVTPSGLTNKTGVSIKSAAKREAYG